MKSTYPTPYPDVNVMLQEVVTAVRTILGDNFVGMYLYGSLVTGDFSEATSDIDYLVVVREPLGDEAVNELAAMHGRLAESESKWGDELEGYYLHKAALRRFVRSDEVHPHRERGEALKVEPLAEDTVIMRHTLWHEGVALAGPDIRELLDPVSDDELRQAVRDLFVGWWRPMITDHSHLQWVGYRVYAITTMCRMLYTLQHGEIVSKPTAARWAMVALDEKWQGLVKTAVNWKGEDWDNLVETVDFIRYVDGEIGEWRLEGDDVSIC
jgi:predicted nucleotidyltransferase